MGKPTLEELESMLNDGQPLVIPLGNGEGDAVTVQDVQALRAQLKAAEKVVEELKSKKREHIRVRAHLENQVLIYGEPKVLRDSLAAAEKERDSCRRYPLKLQERIGPGVGE
jgi:hypothetical protein